MNFLLWLSLLMLAGRCRPACAQDPIGTPSECGPGKTYRVQCYFNAGGYLADVIYRNTVPPTDIAICNAPQLQLQQSLMTQLEISASDSFVRMHVCSDVHGVKGIVFGTLLGERLECGVKTGQCTEHSSRGLYPLAGFSGSCAALHRRHWGQKFTVVTQLFQACWNIQAQAPTAVCPPGAGSPGGGQPCLSCPPGFYSTGGQSPCLPCPTGRTTIAPAQSSCGCFPGAGVYGPVYQDADVCETCPEGTYSIGGTLSPCQPCSTDAFSFLTSAAGSSSIADCTCAAGFGSTDDNPKVCSTCPLNSYNEGPLPRAQQNALGMLSVGPRAANDGKTQSNSTKVGSQGRAVQEEGSHSSAQPAKHQPDTPSKLAQLLSSRKPRAQHHTAFTRALTGTIWRSEGQQNSRQPASGFRLWRGSSDSSSSSSLRYNQSESTISGRSMGIQQPQASVGTRAAAKPQSSGSAAAVGTAQVHPQQFLDSWGFLRNSGVNPVFYEPTYSPCTQCGPACYTNSPGSTSVKDCICAVPAPQRPSPSPTPSPPTPSPSPPPPPNPSPSPSPSPPPSPPPSPTPPSPQPPSPTPGNTCVTCNIPLLEEALEFDCAESSQQVFVSDFCNAVPVLEQAVLYSTSPINIMQGPEAVDCTLVAANPNALTNLVVGLLSDTQVPATCVMPAPYPLLVPDVTSARNADQGLGDVPAGPNPPGNLDEELPGSPGHTSPGTSDQDPWQAPGQELPESPGAPELPVAPPPVWAPIPGPVPNPVWIPSGPFQQVPPNLTPAPQPNLTPEELLDLGNAAGPGAGLVNPDDALESSDEVDLLKTPPRTVLLPALQPRVDLSQGPDRPDNQLPRLSHPSVEPAKPRGVFRQRTRPSNTTFWHGPPQPDRADQPAVDLDVGSDGMPGEAVTPQQPTLQRGFGAQNPISWQPYVQPPATDAPQSIQRLSRQRTG